MIKKKNLSNYVVCFLFLLGFSAGLSGSIWQTSQTVSIQPVSNVNSEEGGGGGVN